MAAVSVVRVVAVSSCLFPVICLSRCVNLFDIANENLAYLNRVRRGLDCPMNGVVMICQHFSRACNACDWRNVYDGRNFDRRGPMFKRENRETNNCSPAYTSAPNTLEASFGINNFFSNTRPRDYSLFYLR